MHFIWINFYLNTTKYRNSCFRFILCMNKDSWVFVDLKLIFLTKERLKKWKSIGSCLELVSYIISTNLIVLSWKGCAGLRSDNLQYNTMGWWGDGMIVPLSDGPIFQHFLQNSSLNYFNYFLLFQFFYNLKKLKSNSLLTVWNALRPSHQPTVLFSIYQNND